jgi:hypothetical protein
MRPHGCHVSPQMLFLPRPRTVKNHPRVELRPQGKCGYGRTFGWYFSSRNVRYDNPAVQDTKLVRPEAERSVGLPGRRVNSADKFRINILTVQGVQLDLGSHDAKILQARKCTRKEEGEESIDDTEKKILAPLLQP